MLIFFKAPPPPEIAPESERLLETPFVSIVKVLLPEMGMGLGEEMLAPAASCSVALPVTFKAIAAIPRVPSELMFNVPALRVVPPP